MPDELIYCVCAHQFYLHDEENHECVNCDCAYFTPDVDREPVSQNVQRKSTSRPRRLRPPGVNIKP